MATTLPPSVSVAPLPSGRLWRRLVRAQIVRRRIAISLVIFTTLISLDIFVFGVLPRDVLNLADPVVLVGEGLILVGLATRSWSAGLLIKQKQLATTGPYSLVRNPLYFGSFLMMFGFGLLIQDWWSAWIIAGPVAAIYLMQIRFEERVLADRFKEEWTRYCCTTPRIIPRLARPTPSQWSFSQWLFNREWQAIVASAAAIVALRVWLTLLD